MKVEAFEASGVMINANAMEVSREPPFASKQMRKVQAFKATGGLEGHISRTRLDSQNSLEISWRIGKTSIHSPSDVFPHWMMAREDFRNIENLVRDRRMMQALESSPYTRRSDEANVLAALISDSWPTAADLGPERVYQLGKCVSYEVYSKGDFILQEGSNSRNFYIIVRGEVNVVRSQEVVAMLAAGVSFGENAVQNGGVTNASCIAHSDTVGLLTLTKTDYDNIMTDILAQERIDAIQILKRVPMFSGWGRSRIDAVARVCRRVRLSPGETIIKQGDPPSNVYFVSHGSLEITRQVPISTLNRWPTGVRSWKQVTRSSFLAVQLGQLERGGVCGEMAVIENKHSFVTVTAVSTAALLSLDKNDFVSALKNGGKLEEVKRMTRVCYPTDKEMLSEYLCRGKSSNP